MNTIMFIFLKYRSQRSFKVVQIFIMFINNEQTILVNIIGNKVKKIEKGYQIIIELLDLMKYIEIH